MPNHDLNVRHSRIAWALTLSLSACVANGPSPAPAPLRGVTLPLVRVDGQRVHGEVAKSGPLNPAEANTDCRDQVAEGTLLIAPNGRSFIYRSTTRDCSGALLQTETNEGIVAFRNNKLEFVIQAAHGPSTFPAAWSDSTVTIYELGGTLEFARR